MKVMLKGKKIFHLLIYFLTLNYKISATAMESGVEVVDFSFNLLEKVSHDKKKQQFIIDFFSPKIIKKGTLIHRGKQMTQGGYGIIYEGSYDNLNLIIKKKKSDEKQKGIAEELKNSNAFLETLAKKLNQDNPDYGNLLGACIIVPVIGTTEDGSLIQEKVQGQNLKTVVSQCLEPYRSGYPDHLKMAITNAACFFSGVVALHYMGFVHCDLKPGNVMILKNANEDNPCRIIDLGGLKKIGEKINIHSSNGGPEYIEQTYTIQKNKLEGKKVKQEKEKITAQIQETSNAQETKQLNRKKKLLKKQLKTIAESIHLAESARCSIAKLSYDIYSSAAVLLTLLFGKNGLDCARRLYFCNTKDPADLKYLQKAQASHFDGQRYFNKQFSKLNRSMKETTNQCYPEPILTRLGSLQAKMSHLDPDKRPTAAQIFEELQDMALADWDHGHYSIQ